MRRFFSLLSFLSFLMPAILFGQSTATIPEFSTAATIDGVADEVIWSTLSENPIDKVFSGDSFDDAADLAAYWKAYFNGDGMFVLVDVTADDALFGTGDPFWERDYVDIYFDMNVGNLVDGLGASNETGHYNLYHLRDPLVETMWEGNWRDDIQVGITVDNSDNSSIHEYFIPWPNLLDENGDVFVPNETDYIGFDVQVTDSDDGAGSRDRLLWSNDGTTDENWNNMDDAGWLSFGTAVTPGVSISDDGTITEGSEDGEVITITLSDDEFVTTLTPAQWSFYNLPDGVTIGSINRTSATIVELTLSGNTTSDYDTEITNFTVVIGADELVTSNDFLSASSGVVFTPKYKAPVSSWMESDGEINEGEEDGELITFYIRSCEFVDNLNINLWWQRNLPKGIVPTNLVRVNDTTVTFMLKGKSAFDYDEDITNFSIKPTRDQIKEFINIPDPIHTIVFEAVKEQTVSIYPVNNLVASMEDGEQILAVIENDTLVNTLTASNWQMDGLPSGVTVQSIEKERNSRVIITLSGNSSGDTPYTLSLTINSNELSASSEDFNSINSIRVGENHKHNIDLAANHKMNEEVALDYLIHKCYETLRLKQDLRGDWGASTYMLANIASDDVYKGGEGQYDTPSYEQIDSLSISPNNTAIQAQWDKNYTGIIRCNTLIEEIGEDVPDANRIIAEAKFLRAYFYFNLVRLYGNVPIITSSCHSTIALPPNSTSEEVYAFIKGELETAVPLLPLKSALASNEKGRVTKGAAQSLLAKVNLYTQDWNTVTEHLNHVISSGEYSLLSTYDSLWSVTQEHNGESIFEVEFSDTMHAQFQSGVAEVGNIDIQFMGVKNLDHNDNSYVRGWGFCKVTPELVTKFTEIDDTIRLQASVLFSDSLKSTFDDPYDFTGYYNKKYTTHKRFTPQNSYMWAQNEVLLRYADVLLMYAEASAQLGNTNDALTYLNMVRSRVNLPTITGINGQALLDTIYAERRLELALESNRYFDVLRWGQAETAFADEAYDPNTNGLWPIPSEVILNSKMVTQNPGYKKENDYFTKDSKFVGYADNSFSPRYNRPYFTNPRITLDSVLNYELSKCNPAATLAAKRKYSYQDDNISSELILYYDKVRNMWIEDEEISYEYDENEYLSYAYYDDIFDGLYSMEHYYDYDNDGYLTEHRYTIYPYGATMTNTYSWNIDHSEYIFVSYDGNDLNPRLFKHDSSKTTLTYSGDTLIETEIGLMGSSQKKSVVKYDNSGSVYEDYYLNTFNSDTNSFQWSKYIVEETESKTTKFLHLYYNMYSHQFDTVAWNYDGFTRDYSYRTILAKEFDEQCQQTVPASITRYFAHNSSPCVPDTAYVSDTIQVGESSNGYSETGIYYITNSGVNGCDSVTVLDLRVEEMNSITQNALANTKVYPNPSQGNVTVEIPAMNGKATLRLVSTTGVIEYAGEVDMNANNIIEITSLKQGIYQLQIQSESGSHTQRLIIQ